DEPHGADHGVRETAPPRCRGGPHPGRTVRLVPAERRADECHGEENLPPMCGPGQHPEDARVLEPGDEALGRDPVEVVEVERVVERRAVAPRGATLEQARGAVNARELEHHQAEWPCGNPPERWDHRGCGQDYAPAAAPAVHRVGLTPA